MRRLAIALVTLLALPPAAIAEPPPGSPSKSPPPPPSPPPETDTNARARTLMEEASRLYSDEADYAGALALFREYPT